jgi:carotenoid 1,2-hydratase
MSMPDLPQAVADNTVNFSCRSLMSFFMDSRKPANVDRCADLADLLGFAAAVAPNGYAWWYVDALSDDGRSGLTIIAFIGSVFSPYYAFARRGGEADPEDHVAFNVALYDVDGSRPGGKRWSMTERGRDALARTRPSLRIGPSRILLEDDGLTIEIDEWTAPLPARLRGKVRVTPVVRNGETFDLDEAGRHRWCPIAPRCRVEVAMARPALSWHGQGYLDRNHGTRPLAADFSYWDWSRTAAAERTAILYDVVRRDGSEWSKGFAIEEDGALTRFAPPPRVALSPNGWRVPRRTRSETEARVIRTFEDTPFYSRSLIRSRLCGESVESMHESLSLDRFRNPIVQTMLPFRMPRRVW